MCQHKRARACAGRNAPRSPVRPPALHGATGACRRAGGAVWPPRPAPACCKGGWYLIDGSTTAIAASTLQGARTEVARVRAHLRFEHRGTRQGAARHTRHAAPRGPARARGGSPWASQGLVRPAKSPLAGAMPPDGARPFSGARRAPPPPVLRHARDFVRGVRARTRIRTLAAVQQSRPRAAQHGAGSGRQRGSVRPRRLRRLGPAQPRRQRARGAGTVHGGAND